jgi:hypothetical protein
MERKSSAVAMTMSSSMRPLWMVCAVLCCLVCGAQSQADPGSFDDTCLSVAAEGKWIVNKADNICGISSAKKISNPGVVDYDKLWAATPEIKKLKKDGIDPNSPEGKALRNQAKTRITKACHKVQGRKGRCSVWKKISHSGTKKATDITAAVKKLF